ncbi:MAG: hypothetical protein DRI23_02095 [Candidatus Cloacimonadota bacterium]|nr:MAG: hypothetical protein DRI23_02095 [Candidatus Cloacimonadota bacterium]
MKRIIYQVLVLSVLLVIVGCASVSTYTEDEGSYNTDKEAREKFVFPDYEGLKTRVQIIRFGIPETIAKQYPELGDKRVGWGLCNRLVESFWETDMFEFVEEKENVVKKMADHWMLSESGIVSEDTAVEAGNLKAPEYLIYAEVYDFGVSHSEEIVGIKVQESNTTVIGIQIRMVNVETGEFVPASAEGRSKTIGIGTWATVDLDFDQTTVGKASQDAINTAIVKLMKRIMKK